MNGVVINVYLKPEILDPQGRAILGALSRSGINDVREVRQGKQFLMKLEEELTDVKLEEIRQVAKTLLSNPVIEDFTIEVIK